jgi:probable rRNA maturation factor
MPASQVSAAANFDVDIVDDDGDWPDRPRLEELIATAARTAFHHVRGEDGSGAVSIALSSDAVVSELNGQFRGKPKPTNVLSFPAGAGAPDDQLGDVILALETVEREATEQSIPFEHHLQHLVVHGIAHLLGYDHDTPTAADEMEAIEVIILSKINVPDPYTGELETGRTA